MYPIYLEIYSTWRINKWKIQLTPEFIVLFNSVFITQKTISVLQTKLRLVPQKLVQVLATQNVLLLKQNKK